MSIFGVCGEIVNCAVFVLKSFALAVAFALFLAGIGLLVLGVTISGWVDE